MRIIFGLVASFVGLLITLMSVFGYFRGFVWLFEGHIAWAICNFLVYGLTLLLGRRLQRWGLRLARRGYAAMVATP